MESDILPYHFGVSYKRPPWKKSSHEKNVYIYISPQQQNVVLSVIQEKKNNKNKNKTKQNKTRTVANISPLSSASGL